MTNVQRIEVPGYQGAGTRIPAGAKLRITDVEGTQIGDLFLINAEDTAEVFSAAITRLVNFTPVPRVGQAFYSNQRRAMLTLTRDHSPGTHDITFAPCDPEFYVSLGSDASHPSCRENYRTAAAALGLDTLEVPDPVNVFQNSPVEQGEYLVGVTPSKAGDYIELEAEMNLYVVLTACSVDIAIDGVQVCGGRSTPLLLEVYA